MAPPTALPRVESGRTPDVSFFFTNATINGLGTNVGGQHRHWKGR